MITPRENFIRIARRKNPQWVILYFGVSQGAMSMFRKYLGADVDISKHFKFDGRWIGPCGGTRRPTPDWRRSGAVLNDSAAPSTGRDMSGPTALIKSTTTLPLSDMLGTPVVNIRLSKSMLSSPDGMGKALSLLKSYLQLGGMQWQIADEKNDISNKIKEEYKCRLSERARKQWGAAIARNGAESPAQA